MGKISLLILIIVFALEGSQLQGLTYLTHVKDIIISTQEIRGRTYKFLNGNREGRDEILRDALAIKEAFGHLDKSEPDSELLKIQYRLLRLNDEVFSMKPRLSFQAYSLMIAEMIRINQRAQELYFNGADPLVKELSAIMVRELLPLSESLGKLRGLGSGVLARGYCEEDETILLNLYIEEIGNILEDTIISMSSLYKDRLAGADILNVRLNSLENHVQEYIDFVQDKVIGRKDIKEDANKYFDQGTLLIYSVMVLYTMNENIIRRASEV